MNKIVKILLDIVVLMVSLTALFILLISVTAKRDSDGSFNIFDHQLKFIISSSMEKSDQTDVSSYEIKDIPIKSMIVIKKLPENKEDRAIWYEGVKVGDVLTFKYLYASQETITHRVVNKTPNNRGGWLITLKGDNQVGQTQVSEQIIDTDQEDSSNYIIGNVVYANLFLGSIISALKEPIGIIFLIIIPSLVILIFQIIKIVTVLNSKKQDKISLENDKRDKELQLLKEQLELMKQSMKNVE